MTSRSPEAGAPLTGIWLSAESVQTPIETLVIDMLASNLPRRVLREAELEELRRGATLADVALEYLGLRTISVDGDGEIPLRVVASHSPRDSWRQALALPEGDRPIGILINTADAGPLVLVHEVFDSFAEPEKELVRRYAALAIRGEPVRGQDQLRRHRVPRLPELLPAPEDAHAHRRHLPAMARPSSAAHPHAVRPLRPGGSGAARLRAGRRGVRRRVARDVPVPAHRS